MEIEDALVDAHLPAVVSVGTLTARRFADQKSELLGGHSYRAGDLQAFIQSLVLQLSTDLLQGSNLGAGQSDSDLVDRSIFDFSSLSDK